MDSFRNTWPLGLVTEVYPGADNRDRVVDVRVNQKTFRRPIVKLVKLPAEAHSACGGECLGADDSEEADGLNY